MKPAKWEGRKLQEETFICSRELSSQDGQVAVPPHARSFPASGKPSGLSITLKHNPKFICLTRVDAP